MKGIGVWKFVVIIVILSLPITLFAQVENWVYRYNGPGHSWDEARSIVYGSDGNIYAAGWSWGSGTAYDFTVISLTGAGTENWIYCYNGTAGGADGACSIVYGSDGNIYAAGYSFGNSGDFTVISLGPAGINEGDVSDSNGPTTVSFVPSLFKDNIKIRFSRSSQHPLRIALYNIYGGRVYENAYSRTPSSIILGDERIKSLSSGVYILSLSVGTENIGKFRLIKL